MENTALKKMKTNKRGQSTLETLVTFIVLVLLFGGIFNIWIWANNQIVRRQVDYNASRVQAGTSSRNYYMRLPQKAEELKEERVLLDAPTISPN